MKQWKAAPSKPSATTLKGNLEAEVAQSSRGDSDFAFSYRPEIDGLRAVAILLVVIYHAFPQALPGGFIGVDVFFVISGFLITGIIWREMQTGRFSFARFYARRFRRLLPAFLVVVVATFAAGFVVLLPDELASLGKHILATSGFSENLLLWKESGYFDVSAETKPLLHFWSLGVEEQFYLFWPALLLLLAAKRKWKPLYLVGVIYAVSLFLSITQVHHDLAGTFYGLSARFWQLLTGSVLVFSFRERNVFGRLATEIVVAASLITLLICAFILNKTYLYPGSWAVIPTLASAFIIALGRQSKVATWILANKIAVFIGLISYPLYLWHWPLLSFLRIAEGAVLTKELIALAILLSFLLAFLTWKFVERPFQRKVYLSALAARSPARIVGVGLAILTLSALVGAITWQLNGFPQRMSQLAGKFEPYVNPYEIWRVHEDKYKCSDVANKKLRDLCRDPRQPGTEIGIWGDSHAISVQLGFERNEIGSVMVSQAGCPPLVGVDSFTGPERLNTCAVPNAEILSYFKKRTDLKTVILIAMDNVYIRQIRGGVAIVQSLEVEGATKPRANEIGLLEGYRNSLKALNEAGKKVIVYLDQPEFPGKGSPRECDTARPFRFSTIPKPSCEQPRAEFDAINKVSLDLFNQLRREFPTVQFFSAFDELCDSKACHGSVGGKRMYYDNDHLSISGGVLMADRLTNLIRLR